MAGGCAADAHAASAAHGARDCLVAGGGRGVFWANQQWRDWFDQLAELDEGAVAALDGAGCPAARTLQDGEIHVTELVLGDEPNPAQGGAGHGPYRVFQITTAPLAGPDGSIQRVVELAQDITEQKRVQAQMMRAGKLAAVGELAGRVAHEVNNPIAIISAKLRLLLSLHRQDMSDKIADDIRVLAEAFIERFAKECEKGPMTLTAEALEVLRHYDWPGNVRELQNVIQRAVALAPGSEITVEELPDALVVRAERHPAQLRDGGFFDLRERRTAAFEKEYLRDLLQRWKGDVASAAKEAQLPRGSLYRLLKKHGLEPGDFRQPG